MKTNTEYISITKKLKLIVAGDKEEVKRVYDFIKDGQYAQYRALNLLMGTLTAKYFACDRNIKNEEFILFQRSIYNKAYLDGLFNDIKFSKGVDTISAVTQTVKKDFSASLKNGLANGDRTITNYKRTYPLLTRGRNLHLCSDHNIDYVEDNLMSNDLELYINWVNKIKFKVVLGSPHKSGELRMTLFRVLKDEYKIQGSKITIKDGKIYLYMTIQMPVHNYVPVKNSCVAVKLDENVIAHCYYNGADKKKIEKYDVGDADELMRVKKLLANQRSRIQSNLRFSKGGKGRNDKLKAYDKLAKRESAFVMTYNHAISKSIINWVIKNKAEKIALEKLDSKNNSLSTEWAYAQLQNLIEYKAKMFGIDVKYVELQKEDYEEKGSLEAKMFSLI